MDHCSKLVGGALLALASLAAHAGYALPVNPPGFSGAANAWQYQAAANDSVAGGIARTAAGPTVNVGGRAITLGAGYRFAANASRYAARGIPPWIAIGITLAPVVLNWINEGGYSVQNGVLVKSDPTVCTVGPCYQYAIGGFPYRSTKLQACNDWKYGGTSYEYRNIRVNETGGNGGFGYCIGDVHQISNGQYMTTNTNNLYRTTVTPSQPVWLPVTPQEFEDGMAPKALPDALPQVLPYPLPVEIPYVNPSPGPTPVSQPLRLPQGTPQPVPNTNPQQYRTPVIDVVPAPAPDAPWRLDLVPRDVTSESPLPLPETSTVPSPNPVTEPQRDPDLCEKYPDILACQKVDLGTLEPEVMKNMDRALVINKDTGWGPSNGSCPAPRTAMVMGVNLSMPFTMICDLATAIRPLMIGFAWLSAALVFFGLGRKE